MQKKASMADATHRIRVVGGGEFFCPEDECVLIAMERAGLVDILVGCRRGGCGVCKVRVQDGMYHNGKMSSLKVTQEEQAVGYSLACRLYPDGDLVVEIPRGRISKSF